MARIAIVGAGLAGRFLALLLAPLHTVTVYERTSLSDARTTGRIAAAMVAPAAESVTASPQLVAMGVHSSQLWQPLLSYLQLQTRFQQTGSLILAHRQDMPELRHFQRRVKLPDAVQVLSREKLWELEPDLDSEYACALWLPEEGHIDNQTLYRELEEKLRASDVELLEGSNVCIRANCVVTDNHSAGNQSVVYDRVIDCRGFGAKLQLAKQQRALRGVRGEVIRVCAPEVRLTRPVRLMHPRYPIYIVPKSHQQYVIGATEIESEDDKALTVRSALELLSAAYSVHRGFAEAQILSLDAALRPTLADNEPRILVRRQQAMHINGLYRHGFLLTPIILHTALRHLSAEGIETPNFAPDVTTPKGLSPQDHLLEIL